MAFNLFTQKDIEDLGGRFTSMPGRYETIHLPGEAGSVTLATDGPVDDKMQQVIATRVLDVLKIANSIGKVAADANLTPQGKANMRRSLESERLKVLNRVEAAVVTIDGVAALAQIALADTMAAPEIENVGDVMADVEIRQWFAGQAPEQLGAAVAGMSQRQLEALKRSPIPLGEPLGQLVDAAWQQYLETGRAQLFAKATDDVASTQWGQNAIAQLRRALERLRFSDAAQVIRPHVEQPEAA